MTYLVAIVTDGASAVVNTVGLVTDVRADDPLRRTVLNLRKYRANLPFSRSVSIIAAGVLVLAISHTQCSSIEP